MSAEDTIAAIATPPGAGAIAVVRLSGSEAFAIAARCLRIRGRTEGLEPRRATLGEFIGGDGEVIDQVLVTGFPGPGSFTGEDVVEFSCHGGRHVTRRVLDVLLEAGARAAQPGEFSERAFREGKIDITQAEAIMDVVGAQTDLALKAANLQLGGALGGKAAAMRNRLVEVLAHLEAHIDFPEEDIEPETSGAWLKGMEEVNRQAEELLAQETRGRMLREGMKVAIIGRPNAGKSSLINRLLGFERAIVSDTPGTTRDTVEEVIDLDGIPIRFVDTAGLREAADPIERLGVERSRDAMKSADVVIHVHAADEPRSDLEGGAVIEVVNKADLERHPSWSDGAKGAVWVSCRTGEGIEALVSRIRSHFDAESGREELVAINARHAQLLRECAGELGHAMASTRAGEPEELTAVALRGAIGALDRISGKELTEDLLDEIFRRFCLGK